MLSKEAISDYKKAGAIIAEALRYGQQLVKPDANILEVCEAVEKKNS